MNNFFSVLSDHTTLALIIAIMSLFPLLAIKGNTGKYICSLVLVCSVFTLTKMANADIEYAYKLKGETNLSETDIGDIDPITTSSTCPN